MTASPASRRVRKFLGLAVGVCLLVVLLPLLVPLVKAAIATMTVTVQLIFNLIGMGLIALLITIFLMPLETLVMF